MQGSPFQQIEWLVEQFRLGHVGSDGFLRGVAAIEEFFTAKMGALPREAEITRPTLAACQRFLLATEHLRGYAARRHEIDCAKALRLARQGQDELTSLVRQLSRTEAPQGPSRELAS